MTLEGRRLWGVIPAAGVGRRFGGAMPKQYLTLPSGISVLDGSIEALFADARVAGVMVALSADDGYWSSQRSASREAVMACTGGAERAHSVCNALKALLAGPAEGDDWVLVHDAARPGLPLQALTRLIDHCLAIGTGAILALPVRDTLKRCDARDRVAGTLSRDGLWQAQTPQMFPLGDLLQALEASLASAEAGDGRSPTDEAAAMEVAGHEVSVVEGSWRNFKLTLSEDAELLKMLE